MSGATAGLYFCNLPQSISNEAEILLISGLPGYRKEKAERYIQSSDRLLSAAVWYLLRYAVNEVFGLDAFNLRIEANESGKPFFADNAHIHFNVSHCKMAVVCAVDCHPCGVDVEALRKADVDIVRRIMPDYRHALMSIKSNQEKNEYFTCLWTEAESVYKSGARSPAGGTILNYCGVVPKNYEMYHFRHEKYFIALCARLPARRFDLRTVSFEKLFIKD